MCIRDSDGTQYIALAHPLAPNPLFLNDAAGLILLDNSECKFIAQDDMDFEIISSNDPSRELFKLSSMNDAISTSENFDELNSAVSARGALMTAALLIGLAQKMIDLSSVYVLDRTQFGKPIGSFQAVNICWLMWRLKLSLQNLLYIGQLILCLKTTLNLLYIVLTQNLCVLKLLNLHVKTAFRLMEQWVIPGRWIFIYTCLLYTSPSPRDRTRSRMPSSA